MSGEAADMAVDEMRELLVELIKRERERCGDDWRDVNPQLAKWWTDARAEQIQRVEEEQKEAAQYLNFRRIEFERAQTRVKELSEARRKLHELT